jgi:hypothetical protein
MTETALKDIKIIVQDNQTSNILLLIGIVFFILGSFPVLLSDFGETYVLILLLFSVGYFTLKLIYFLQARGYKQVKAEIEDYYIVEHRRYDGESKTPSLDYEVHIHYAYQYNGNIYNSQKVGIDKSQYYFKEKLYFADEREAKNDSIKYLHSFVKNPNFSAYVNPLYSKEVVLDTKINIEIILLNIAYIIIAISIFLWLI